jgi:pre-mRNA-splicing factor CWC22
MMTKTRTGWIFVQKATVEPKYNLDIFHSTAKQWRKLLQPGKLRNDNLHPQSIYNNLIHFRSVDSISRSRSRSRSGSPPRRNGSDRYRDRSPQRPVINDFDPVRRRERERQMQLQQEMNAVNPPAKRKVDPAEEMRIAQTTTKAGGAYIPPHKLRRMQQDITDKSSTEYQRITWEALKKSINGLINKVNTNNIKMIIPEVFGENLVRGRGLFCRSIMKAQAASLPFTPVYAALAAVINTKLPSLGELLLTRLVVQFRRAFKRNDKVRILDKF